MSSTYTYTSSQTLTKAHARKISYRVVTDLKRMQTFYKKPTDIHIKELEEELVELLVAGYLDNITYGFRRNDNWIEPSLRYTAYELNQSGSGDNPGRVRPGANITGATFCSYLIYSDAWLALRPEDRKAFEAGLSIKRNGAPEPGVNGYFQQDLEYYAGGRGVRRQRVKS